MMYSHCTYDVHVIRAGLRIEARDLWEHTPSSVVDAVSGVLEVTLAPHESVLLLLSASAQLEATVQKESYV